MKPLDRVRAALFAQADGEGYIRKWSASKAYADAGLPGPVVEGQLAVLVHLGELEILPGARRSMRLITVPADAAGVAIHDVVRLPGERDRIGFTAWIEGVGSVKECVYVRSGAGFIAGPSVRRGANFVSLAQFTTEVALKLRAALDRYLASNQLPD